MEGARNYETYRGKLWVWIWKLQNTPIPHGIGTSHGEHWFWIWEPQVRDHLEPQAWEALFVSLHIRSMWETICDPTASLLGWLSLSDSFSQCDLVFCAFTDVAGSLSQSDLVFCAGSLSQSDLVFCAFTDVACGWKWPIFCTGSYPLWRLIFSIRLMF